MPMHYWSLSSTRVWATLGAVESRAVLRESHPAFNDRAFAQLSAGAINNALSSSGHVPSSGVPVGLSPEV